jgi:hypothetical protein
MKSPELQRVDFSKSHKDLYSATSKVKEVLADKATFLSVEGKGEPGGAAFQSAIGQLYSLAYTTKFMLKYSGKIDFAVGKLECLWQTDKLDAIPREEWPWQMIIRIPDGVTESDLKKARREIQEKRHLDTSAVRRWTWREGRCLQVLHVGPYDEVGGTFRQLDECAGSMGLQTKCPGHEIYLSDPGRVAPAKLKTIIRLPVARA